MYMTYSLDACPGLLEARLVLGPRVIERRNVEPPGHRVAAVQRDGPAKSAQDQIDFCWEGHNPLYEKLWM